MLIYQANTQSQEKVQCTCSKFHFYDKLVAGFIGRDYKKLDQLVNLHIKRFEYPSIYYELKRYDMQRIFTIKELVMETIIPLNFC